MSDNQEMSHDQRAGLGEDISRHRCLRDEARQRGHYGEALIHHLWMRLYRKLL